MGLESESLSNQELPNSDQFCLDLYKVIFTLYHGKSPSNHHLGEYLLLYLFRASNKHIQFHKSVTIVKNPWKILEADGLNVLMAVTLCILI